MARVRAGLRIVLLTQDMRHAMAELAALRDEVERARKALQLRGVEWPERDSNGRMRKVA
jgi:hypothetical protein